MVRPISLPTKRSAIPLVAAKRYPASKNGPTETMTSEHNPSDFKDQEITPIGTATPILQNGKLNIRARC